MAAAHRRPSTCHFCGDVVKRIGPKRFDGCVHHLDGDPCNNVDENIVVAHRRCHSSYHQTADNSSPWSAHKRGGGRPPWKGKTLSEEHRAKISASVSAYWRRKEADHTDPSRRPRA